MPKMTRKDFEFIAETLRASRPGAYSPLGVRSQWYWTVIEFANALEVTNPQFNARRFLDAAGAVDGILNEV